MKKLALFNWLAIFAAVLFMYSCTDDTNTTPGGGGGGVIINAPTVDLINEAGFVTSDITVDPGSIFSVKISATPEEGTLNDFSLQENGVNIDATRFSVNGVTAAANPILIFSPDNTGLTWEISVKSQETSSTSSYAFNFTDSAGETTTRTIDVTTELGAGNPPVVTTTISGNFDVEAGSLVTIPVSITAGDHPLNTIAVYENDELISAARLYYGSLTNPFADNPLLIPDADKSGIEGDIFVRVNDNPGTYDYSLVVTDEFGTSTPISWTVVSAPTGTPVGVLTAKLLKNAGGPTGTGGMDLDTGDGTGSSDPLAEIKDQGIDGSALELNWIQRISGVNGTTLKLLVPGNNGLSESFNYNNISFKEEIAGLWDAGLDFTETVNGESASWLVEIGDTFIAEKGGSFYLFTVTDINNTAADNNDYYELSIKQ